MASPVESRARVRRLLEEVRRATGGVAGAELYLDDGEGGLVLVAETAGERPRRSVGGLFRPGRGGGRSLLTNVPDERPGLLVVHRSRDDEFSNGDRAIARLYARQLAERVAAAVAAMQPRSALWTRQLEAVQAISARLVRLATVAPRG